MLQNRKEPEEATKFEISLQYFDFFIYSVFHLCFYLYFILFLSVVMHFHACHYSVYHFDVFCRECHVVYKVALLYINI